MIGSQEPSNNLYSNFKQLLSLQSYQYHNVYRNNPRNIDCKVEMHTSSVLSQKCLKPKTVEEGATGLVSGQVYEKSFKLHHNLGCEFHMTYISDVGGLVQAGYGYRFRFAHTQVRSGGLVVRLKSGVFLRRPISFHP